MFAKIDFCTIVFFIMVGVTPMGGGRVTAYHPVYKMRALWQSYYISLLPLPFGEQENQGLGKGARWSYTPDLAAFCKNSIIFWPV